MQTRKVNIFEWRSVDEMGKPFRRANGSPCNGKVKFGTGLFHQWGCNYEEFETGPGNYSTAIVEMEDGKIKNIPCDLIQFIK